MAFKQVRGLKIMLTEEEAASITRFRKYAPVAISPERNREAVRVWGQTVDQFAEEYAREVAKWRQELPNLFRQKQTAGDREAMVARWKQMEWDRLYWEARRLGCI